MSLDALLSSTRWIRSEVLDTALEHVRLHPWYIFDAAVACTAVWTLLRWARVYRQQLRTTQLRGPPSESFLYGVGKQVLGSEDSGAVYEAWAEEYGPVYRVPWSLGKDKVMLCDPKAIAHFYARDSWTYDQTVSGKKFQEKFIGRGLMWAHGEDHKRQRRSLAPAFSIAAIRQSTAIFYDSAYKAKGAWDALIESNGGDSAIIDVQSWMNHISLDTIGIAGFSHNFGALEGKHAHVTQVFDSFGGTARTSAVDIGRILLSEVLTFVLDLPTSRTRLLGSLNDAMEEISNVLLARTQKELEMSVVGGKGEKSIIGLLIKGTNGESEFHLTKEEVMAQMKVLLIAGYETTSISLSWALIELSRNPDMQTRLRNELLDHGADPTYDEFSNGLFYLDAVVHETLRLHPPIPTITRVATEDDVIPLSEPMRTRSGELVDKVTIAKGRTVSVSSQGMNRSVAVWGEDAKVFRPTRWLVEGADGQDGISAKAKEIQGHRHLLTFIDGPRACLGKNFAVAEFKAVLSVLIKNFVFEMRDGADSKIEMGRGLLPRPKVAGEEGCKLPLLVRPYVA